MKIACITIILSLTSTVALTADIRAIIPEQSGINHIYIIGEIQKGDFEKFKQRLDLVKGQNRLIGVGLSSVGGDLIEAVKIGRLIRSSFLLTEAPSKVGNDIYCPWVEINPQCNCASACFLIWASGIQRDGTVLGLHRPYFSKEHFEKLSASAAKTKYVSMSNEVKTYLKEMDIPDNVIERMFSINSDEIFYLEEDTTKSIERVPFFDEWIRAECKEPTKEEKEDQLRKFLQTRRPEDFRSEKQKAYSECWYRRVLEAQRVPPVK